MKTINGLLLATILLTGCNREPAVDITEGTAAPEPIAVAPALVNPSEVADPAQPPSYEVSIASAAADRNKAIERCATQPEAVRTQCEQEANAAFAEREGGLQDLRGNQQ
jgi:hypothetical protein